ncbi:hypothetical protein [Lutibacter sp. B1]|uniref:hypothetical protein n=1 Tax=Lutibacter sp. B1 TaxID=2725996 RepID=UPI0014564F50|nr:hypothetical protein [Lutibacter sp. B1]NLP58961.1 hypothetical protein [Lutibacter sp. B1]
MRTLGIIISIIGFVTLSSCNQKTNSKNMLENSETRTEIYEAISNNHEYMTEFMDKMQSSNHGMQMMQGNKKMMGTMMQGNGMQMMMNDSVMMKNMMQSIMKDGRMMGTMMKMMQQNGMMSNDCMQSSMKMMNDKGMDMKGMKK